MEVARRFSSTCSREYRGSLRRAAELHMDSAARRAPDEPAASAAVDQPPEANMPANSISNQRLRCASGRLHAGRAGGPSVPPCPSRSPCLPRRCPTRSRRLRTPVLSKTVLRWSCTVFLEMCRVLEIAVVDRPRRTRRATSASRPVRPYADRRTGAVVLRRGELDDDRDGSLTERGPQSGGVQGQSQTGRGRNAGRGLHAVAKSAVFQGAEGGRDGVDGDGQRQPARGSAVDQ